MPEVQIISRLPAQLTDVSGVAKPALAVTYSTQAVPPRTVTVPGDNPTDAEIAEAVRKDLAEASDATQSTLEI